MPPLKRGRQWTGWSNWIIQRKWKYCVCCLRYVILKIQSDLSSSRWNTQFQGWNSVGPPCSSSSSNDLAQGHSFSSSSVLWKNCASRGVPAFGIISPLRVSKCGRKLSDTLQTTPNLKEPFNSVQITLKKGFSQVPKLAGWNVSSRCNFSCAAENCSLSTSEPWKNLLNLSDNA